jgi:hypothetical protein
VLDREAARAGQVGVQFDPLGTGAFRAGVHQTMGDHGKERALDGHRVLPFAELARKAHAMRSATRSSAGQKGRLSETVGNSVSRPAGESPDRERCKPHHPEASLATSSETEAAMRRYAIV